MQKLCKIITFCCASIVVNTTYAVPNIWEGGYATMGYSEYSLSNKKNQTITVACNEGAGNEYDHGFYFYPKGTNGKTLNPNTISVLFDNKKTAYPPADNRLPSTTRGGANEWINFAEGISKARSITVYSNNKLVGTFSPTAQSVKSVASEIGKCRPVGW
ncbi:MAG TPA: hypothetical protein DGB97_12400 [Staphylococcus sp.]|jgi:hypothetical protein|nr:hypothetical protein [Staphylococcus sp.]